MTTAHTFSNNTLVDQNSLSQIKLYRNEDGNIPFWDDPTVYGGIERPTNFMQNADVLDIIASFYRGKYIKEDVIILSMLRDAMAISEHQLRRLLKPVMTSSTLSDRLRFMAVHGIVDQYKFRSRDNENYKPPAVWTVGIGGFYYLKHQSHKFVLNPRHLYDKGIRNIQKFVSINEIRTQMYEHSALKWWRWHGVLDGNPTLGKPAGIGILKGSHGDLCLCIDRVQQSQLFINFISTRLVKWNRVFEQKDSLPVMDVPEMPTVIGVSTPTYEMAKKIVSKIPFAQFSIPVWFIVDEVLEKEGLPSSVYIWSEGELKNMPLSFLKPREE